MLTAYDLYQKLSEYYPSPPWWSEDPYRVMVEAVLVQNTSFRNVRNTTNAFPLSPQWLSALSTDELTARIRPCGAYQRKASTLRALTNWYQQYQYNPQNVRGVSTSILRKELLALHGIGEETADVILTYAFYRPLPIIDHYTRQFLRRLGFSFQSDDQIRRFFNDGLSKEVKIFGNLHWLILEHSISYCKKNPLCGECPFRKEKLCEQLL